MPIHKHKEKAVTTKTKKISKSRNIFYCLVFFGVLALFAFIIIYLIFSSKGFIPSGINLSRKDWLSFVGTYLSFVGTMSVSLIAIYQTRHHNKMAEKERKRNRQKEISPIFSLEITETENTPQTIRFKNVAKFPVRNVSLNDTFYFELLPMNCEQIIDFLDEAERFSCDFGQNKYGYPNLIVVNYEDVDGNAGFHTFIFKDDMQCKKYGYYRLDEKETAITED